MAVADRSPAVAAPPYEQGWPYLYDLEAGDTLTIRPSLRQSGGRVSFGWTLTVGAGASIARQYSMQWPQAVWTTPLTASGDLEAPFTSDWIDYEDSPFQAFRLTQTGGGKSTLSIVSRFPLLRPPGLD